MTFDPDPRATRTRPELFSTAEVKSLMQIEFERSRRHGYPVCCLALRPDRIEELGLYYGQESKDEVLARVGQLVQSTIRAGDLLLYRDQDRLVILLPHMPPTSLAFLCERILREARELRFDSGSGSQRGSLSIGASHSRHPEASSSAVLERVALDGLSVAEAAGGDRWVESELYALEARRATKAEPSVLERAPLAEAERVLPNYRRRLLELVENGEGLQEAAWRVADEIISRALGQASPGGQAGAEELDILRRRVAKLTRTLGVTEQELEELRAFRETALARAGEAPAGPLSAGTRDDLKRALMQTIFEANQDLRRRADGAA